MVVNVVSDAGLFRDGGRGFLISLRASNRYSPPSLDALEWTVALLAMSTEEQEWPAIAQVTTTQPEE